MKTLLITDSCSDLPIDYILNNNIIVLPLTFHFNGKDYVDDFGKTISYKEFYDEVRNGAMPTTSQINSFTFKQNFSKYTSEGYSIIYIAFSSALSGTCNSAIIARREVLDENPSADISIIDSKCASMGLGLLVYYSCEKLKSGMPKDELVIWIENNKLKVNHWITVDSLHHLKRGGRISPSAAVIGSLLSIKPIIYIDKEGRLLPVSKVKGRKKSLRTLADEVKARIVDQENQVIAISHSDCYEDAKVLESILREELRIKDVILSTIGPVVGSHTGPGTVAVFFFGDKR